MTLRAVAVEPPIVFDCELFIKIPLRSFLLLAAPAAFRPMRLP
jgi:hypothetical protein